MKRIILLLFLFVIWSLPRSTQAFNPSSFTVENSVNRERLYDVRPNSVLTRPFLFSQDGSKIFFISGKGDLSNNTYIWKLQMLESQDILNYLSGLNEKSPEPVVIAQRTYDRSAKVFSIYDNSGIKDITVSNDGDRVYYVAVDSRGIMQLYVKTISGGPERQLTYANYHVTDYSVREDKNLLLFSTNYRNNSNDCQRTSFIVGTRELPQAICLSNGLNMFENYYGDQPGPSSSAIYISSLGGSGSARMVASGIKLATPLASAEVSPDRMNLILQIVSKVRLSELNSESSDNLTDTNVFMVDYDRNVMTMPAIYKYNVVVSIKKGDLTVIDRVHRADGNSSDLAWISNEEILIMDGNDPTANGELRNSADIFNLKHKKMIDRTIIRSNSVKYKQYINSIVASKKSESLNNLTLDNCRRTDDGIDDDVDDRPSCYSESPIKSLLISTDESYNRLGHIYATDTKTGVKKLLVKMNPDFDTIIMGEVRLLKWTDQTGRNWQAGLVLPPNYVKGHRYPLVVQMHGFDPNAFLIDGPYYGTAPYAAQALAARNIVVLQMPNFRPYKLANESAILAHGVNSAIRILDEEKIVNIKKIGLTGYSARGSFVFDLILFPQYEVAAAVIADAFSASPFGYAAFFGFPPPGLRTHELLACGATPWGKSRSQWVDRNPFHQLDRMNTPLLLKEYTPLLTSWWDVYAGLRRLHKPVDFRIYTSGGHPPGRIDTIADSQKLVVEWFNFWLNGVEELTPEKENQYRIWNEMRRGLQRTKKNEPPANSLSEMGCDQASDMPY